MSVGRRLLAVALVAGGLTLPLGPPAYAEEAACSDITDDTTDADEVDDPSVPLKQMRIEEATELLERRDIVPGERVGVAVVDSGVTEDGTPVAEIDELRNPTFARSERDVYYHGTAVAGLIAGRSRVDGGPVGIAPGASVVDVKVYDAPEDSDDGEFAGLTDGGVIDGLEAIAANLNKYPVPIRIVNVSLAVPDTPQLERAVKNLTKRGVVVVASSGNRPEEGDTSSILSDFAGEPRPGEDAAGVVFPAGYESVVAAATTVPPGVDPRAAIVQSSAIDIAAPTFEAVSYGVNGVSCLLQGESATSWAAAQVSGVLALLMSAYPGESSDRIVARMLRTASGPGEVKTRTAGHGVVQPLEALRRPMTFNKADKPKFNRTNNTVQQAQAPRPEADVLADTRRDAVWWGLVGVGALVIALLLRPVLARRRDGR